MKKMSKKRILPVVIFSAALSALPCVSFAQTKGIPTFDISTFMQAQEMVAGQLEQLEKMTQDYLLQYQKYENMVRNTVAPTVYTWSKIQETAMQLERDRARIEKFANGISENGLDSYFDKFKDVAYYSGSSCWNASGECTGEQLWDMRLFEYQKNKMQQLATQDNLQSLNAVLKKDGSIEQDLKRLAELQESARKAGDDKDGGMLKVMQANNQFQSEILKQNLELRKMIAQQNQMIAMEKLVKQDELNQAKAYFDNVEQRAFDALSAGRKNANSSAFESGNVTGSNGCVADMHDNCEL